MTAVDHAEPGRATYEANSKQFDVHPFFCRAAEWDDLPADTKAHYAMVERTVRAPLLSEVEGLKAERSFAQSVADVEIEDIDLEYAVVNLLYGRGAIDKKTKTDAVVAVKTLRSIIKAAKALRPQTAESGK